MIKQLGKGTEESKNTSPVIQSSIYTTLMLPAGILTHALIITLRTLLIQYQLHLDGNSRCQHFAFILPTVLNSGCQWILFCGLLPFPLQYLSSFKNLFVFVLALLPKAIEWCHTKYWMPAKIGILALVSQLSTKL